MTIHYRDLNEYYSDNNVPDVNDASNYCANCGKLTHEEYLEKFVPHAEYNSNYEFWCEHCIDSYIEEDF